MNNLTLSDILSFVDDFKLLFVSWSSSVVTFSKQELDRASSFVSFVVILGVLQDMVLLSQVDRGAFNPITFKLYIMRKMHIYINS